MIAAEITQISYASNGPTVEDPKLPTHLGFHRVNLDSAMEVEEQEEARLRDTPASHDSENKDGEGSDATTLLSTAKVKDNSTQGAKLPVLAWNTIVSIMTDAEPVSAAGVAGVVVILVLTIFGRIGSLIVGMLGGLLLYASFEKNRGNNDIPWARRFMTDESSDEKITPRETSLDVIPPKTNLALRYFWDLLIRDYVDWWFSPLSSDAEFPSACRRSLEYIASSFTSHVQSKVPSEIVMLSIMSASSTLIVFFRELRTASVETESATGISDYIRNNPDSALAQMVDEKFQQEKLRHLAMRLLALFAKKSDRECEAGLLFAREMLAMQVLNLTATSCSTSSYINWYIVETFKEVQDQGGLLGNDSRAKEAEEAMRRAAAEAAEMTRMLEAEKNGEHSSDTVAVIPVGDLPVESAPKTTFGSLLKDPDILPQNPEQVDAILRRSGSLPPPPDRIDEIETLRAFSGATSPNSLQPVESARLSSTSLQYEEPPQETLQGANISLMDLSTDVSTGKPIRQKATLSYMITIELVGGRVPGWVAIKQFSDFESLHDVLRRLANVSGLRSFPAELPEWKGKMHQLLADELEKYLKNALGQKQLADSEAMKRFFGKEINDLSLGKKKAWPPLKGVGEGMRGAMLSSAEGSQKLLAAAWATTGINKKRSSTPIGALPKAQTEATLKDIMKPPSESTLKDIVTDDIPTPDEEDTAYHSPLFRESATFLNQMNSGPDNGLQRSSTSSSLNGYSFIEDGDMSNSASSSSLNVAESVPPRSDVAQQDTPRISQTFNNPPRESSEASRIRSPSPLPPPLPERHPNYQAKPNQQPPPLPERTPRPRKPTAPELSANDAQQILDIGFTILSEFYALSPRTWLIRKSLLNLLKSLLISNGLTYIETIRTMIQEDLIKNCLTSDEWIAGQVKAVTDSMWPPTPWPPMDDEVYKLQAKELFINKMLPETMRGLMGGAATSQALEIVFEALQDQRVAKGILVALMCDLIRALQV